MRRIVNTIAFFVAGVFGAVIIATPFLIALDAGGPWWYGFGVLAVMILILVSTFHTIKVLTDWHVDRKYKNG